MPMGLFFMAALLLPWSEKLPAEIRRLKKLSNHKRASTFSKGYILDNRFPTILVKIHCII